MRGNSIILLLMGAAACTTKQPASRSDSAAALATSPAATANGAVPATESPVAPEVNPPGDIPDTQAFVPYSSASSGYSIEVPEGWARTGDGPSVTFVSKLDGLRVEVAPATSPPTATSAATEAKQIQAKGRAVNIASTSVVSLPSGNAVLIAYESNSEPNSVTQKQVRLENEAFVVFRNGKQAIVTMWAPKGADNADQWKRMSRSFRWQ